MPIVAEVVIAEPPTQGKRLALSSPSPFDIGEPGNISPIVSMATEGIPD